MIEHLVAPAAGRPLAMVREGGELDGVPVVFHHGTPSSRHAAGLADAAAHRSGVRLISFNRPGYGVAPDTSPSLASVGADTVRIADALGLDRFAVVGVSGGGPYALATALAAPERIAEVAVVAGIGPRRLVDLEALNDRERDLLADADAGRLDSALAGFRAELAADLGDILAIADDRALIAAYLDGAPPDDLRWLDDEKLLIWAADLREATTTFDGYARDNVAWGAEWDIDVTSVGSPVRLYYGGRDRLVPPEHGHWLADHLPGAELILLPDAGHGTTSYGDWDTIFQPLRSALS